MKQRLRKSVETADTKRKANPLDLSSDQDLTIALMNLIAIEDIAQGSQVARLVQGMRGRLMSPMLAKIKTDARACEHALELLRRSVQYMQDAENAQLSGDFGRANQLYGMVYEFYVLYLATVYKISA